VDNEQMVPTWQLSDGELTAALLHAQKLLNQGYGRSIDLTEEAETRGLASCKGYRNTARFLASTLNLSTRESKARVAYATLAMPLARKELAAGRITCEHMFEIHQVLSLAPADLSDDLRDYAERTLVELAVQAQPLSVKTAGIRLKAYWDIDKPPKDPEDRLARPRRRLKYWFSTDGQMHFTGELDPETAALLKGILTPLAKPRPVDEFGQEDTRDEDERNGDALAEALGLVNNAPDLPATGGSRAAVIVTLTLEELERRAGMLFLGDIGYSTVSHLRRLCCDAQVVPAVLGSQGQILDFGRSRRLASPAQCLALALRDRGCSRPGCRRPPKHCRAHHVIPWSEGGETKIDNMALLCDFHHRELHHTEWSMRMVNGIPEFIPPKYLDQEQKPIRNRMHGLPHEVA
jgi:hypothetical protein